MNTKRLGIRLGARRIWAWWVRRIVVALVTAGGHAAFAQAPPIVSNGVQVNARAVDPHTGAVTGIWVKAADGNLYYRRSDTTSVGVVTYVGGTDVLPTADGVGKVGNTTGPLRWAEVDALKLGSGASQLSVVSGLAAGGTSAMVFNTTNSFAGHNSYDFQNAGNNMLRIWPLSNTQTEIDFNRPNTGLLTGSLIGDNALFYLKVATFSAMTPNSDLGTGLGDISTPLRWSQVDSPNFKSGASMMSLVSGNAAAPLWTFNSSSNPTGYIFVVQENSVDLMKLYNYGTQTQLDFFRGDTGSRLAGFYATSSGLALVTASAYTPLIDNGATLGSSSFRWLNTYSTSVDEINNAINAATNRADGVLLENDTGATALQQQYSPPLVMEGEGWSIAEGLGQSSAETWYQQVKTIAGANSTSQLRWSYAREGAAAGVEMTLTPLGLQLAARNYVAVGSYTTLQLPSSCDVAGEIAWDSTVGSLKLCASARWLPAGSNGVGRYYVGGTTLVSGDIAPGAGFGSTASVSAVLGHDGFGEFKITAGGIGLANNATVVVTFHDGTWTTVPLCHAWVEAVTGVTAVLNTPLTDSETATTYTITYNGTALTAGDTVTLSFLCEGT